MAKSHSSQCECPCQESSVRTNYSNCFWKSVGFWRSRETLVSRPSVLNSCSYRKIEINEDSSGHLRSLLALGHSVPLGVPRVFWSSKACPTMDNSCFIFQSSPLSGVSSLPPTLGWVSLSSSSLLLAFLLSPFFTFLLPVAHYECPLTSSSESRLTYVPLLAQ